MSETCKNCEHEIVLNFCGNCGQKKMKRIDRNYIKDEIQYTILHTNKGFFYSVKKLLRAPGKTTREFIEGNRVNHYKPLLLVFVLAGISAFLTNSFVDTVAVFARYNQSQEMKAPAYILENISFVMKYYAIIMFLSVPIMAVFFWACFKKWGYNYYENIIINANFISLYLILNSVIIIPLQYLLKDNINLAAVLPSTFALIIFFAEFFWFYINLYKDKSGGYRFKAVFHVFHDVYGLYRSHYSIHNRICSLYTEHRYKS